MNDEVQVGWHIALHHSDHHPRGIVIRIEEEDGERVCVVKPERRLAMTLHVSEAFVRRWRV